MAETDLHALIETWRKRAEYANNCTANGEWSPTYASGQEKCADELAALLSGRPSLNEPCAWIEDSDGVWNTSCGVTWVFTDGSPAENRTNFCHHCGHPVKPQTYIETLDADDDSASPIEEPTTDTTKTTKS